MKNQKNIDQMRDEIPSGPRNQPVGLDVPCRAPQTRNVAIRAILCRITTRVTRDFARESLTFEEERRRWQEDKCLILVSEALTSGLQ